MIHAGRYYEAHIVCKIDDGVYSGTLVPDKRGTSCIVVPGFDSIRGMAQWQSWQLLCSLSWIRTTIAISQLTAVLPLDEEGTRPRPLLRGERGGVA